MREALSADSGRGSGIESETCGNVDNGRGKMNYGIIWTIYYETKTTG